MARRQLLRWSIILDEPVSDIGAPILQPTKPELFTQEQTKLKSEVSTFADWLISYVPEPIKKEVNKRWKR